VLVIAEDFVRRTIVQNRQFRASLADIPQGFFNLSGIAGRLPPNALQNRVDDRIADCLDSFGWLFSHPSVFSL
jgi:hypothetical protein